MSRLPSISGRECAAALAKAGFYVKRQESSHKELDRVTLRAIIRVAGLGVQEFIKML